MLRLPLVNIQHSLNYIKVPIIDVFTSKSVEFLGFIVIKNEEGYIQIYLMDLYRAYVILKSPLCFPKGTSSVILGDNSIRILPRAPQLISDVLYYYVETKNEELVQQHIHLNTFLGNFKYVFITSLSPYEQFIYRIINKASQLSMLEIARRELESTLLEDETNNYTFMFESKKIVEKELKVLLNCYPYNE